MNQPVINNQLVSIILVTYNTAKYLMEAVNSVFEQNYRNFELIIIDDGSTDGTVEIIKSIKSPVKFTAIFRDHTGNVGKLRNDAINIAEGDLIAFIDGDDIWKSDKLQKQIEYIDKHDLVCSNAKEIDGLGKITDERMFKNKSDIKNDLGSLININYVLTSSVLLKKNILNIAGLFDEDVGIRGEDYILWLSIAEQGSIYFCPEELIFYRRHSSNLSFLNNDERKQLLLRTIYIRKKYWAYPDQNVSRSAKKGCIDLFGELCRISLKNKQFSETGEYCRYYLELTEDRTSLKYLKMKLLYFYLIIFRGV